MSDHLSDHTQFETNLTHYFYFAKLINGTFLHLIRYLDARYILINCMLACIAVKPMSSLLHLAREIATIEVCSSYFISRQG